MRFSPAEIARRCGVSADTIRYYEREGVIPASDRLPNGYRRYPESVIARVRIVRSALRLGFTIAEIAMLLRDRSRGNPPCRKARALAAEKLRDIERQIGELISLRESLKQLLCDWDERLGRTPAGAPANLLDTLKGDDDVYPDHSPVPSRRRLSDARAAHARR